MVDIKKEKFWQVKKSAPDELADRFPEINPIVRQLLYNRSLDTQEKIDEFLYPDYSQDLHDPFLFKDMTTACQRIWQAVSGQEKVVIYGDYDADGVCATTVLAEWFKAVGCPVVVYIPHREIEGYGLNQSAVEEFINQQVNLLITVDCGTTNINEVKSLQAAGIDVIVTDHHHVPTEHVSPLAFLNCSNPDDNYPFPHLAGVGMAFKLVQGLIAYSKKNNLPNQLPNGWEKWLLDLVAIATVTDIMPLIGENHTLVKYGLLVLNKTRRSGLKHLFNTAGLQPPLDTWSIGFIIGPRLNAAGRIDHANDAYALLNESDQVRAKQLAEKLHATNSKRQALTEQFVKEAKLQVEAQFLSGDNILTAYGENWDLGLVGLVAGRITEMFRRPTLVMTLNQGKIMGSGRSLAGFSIIAAVEQQRKFLDRFGGHEGACGFTLQQIEKLDDFVKSVKLATREIDTKIFTPSLLIDAVVNLADIDWSLIEELQKFEPFGEANTAPRFVTYGLQVFGIELVGEEQKHLRLLVGDEQGLVRKTIGFGLGKVWGNLQMGDQIDLVYEAGINQWNGNRELQLKIIDIKKHE